MVGGTGAINVQDGPGGGLFWGNNAGDTITAGAGQAVMVAGKGGTLTSAGSAGDFLVALTGDTVMNGGAATGNDVFLSGTAGKDTITAGSGNNLIGTGTRTSAVQLGAGHDMVFAFGTSTVTAGFGSAGITMGGTATLNIASGPARTFALFNFVPGTDRISPSGYASGTAANALATQVSSGSLTVLTLGDQTRIELVGVTRADASVFG